ncbi:MAG: metallophosphoesterase [Deltaproteobacteria bacterium]|jgi:3',5'-cyclic AMP phosphodiesterase CpdA|nr:metallophosphoesterase [Deltaproteobacteria bacterium]
MLVAQITDLHILANRAPAYGVCDTSQALEALEDYLFKLAPPLDALVMTGDLADLGEPEAYAFIARLFARWSIPVLALPGNHDARGPFLRLLGPFCPTPRPDNLSFAFRLGPLNLIMLDDVLEGQHGGHLSPEAGDFLQNELAAEPAAQTILFTHHPPFASGLGVLDEPFGGLTTLLTLLSQYPGRLSLASGHLHRGLVAELPPSAQLPWPRPIRALVAPPVGMPIELEIGPYGGRKFFLGAPGFALHLLDGDRRVSHFGAVPGAWPFSGPHPFD